MWEPRSMNKKSLKMAKATVLTLLTFAYVLSLLQTPEVAAEVALTINACMLI